MKCPVCGAKIKYNICPYCQDVTTERILNASNQEAKRQFVLKDKTNVHYSSTLPNDINKTKLKILVVFFNWLGIGDWYAGKKYKSMMHFIPLGITFLLTAITLLNDHYLWGVENSLMLITSLPAMLSAIGLIIWFFDAVNVLVGRYKVPVVLPEIKKVNNKNNKQIKIKK